MSEISASQFQQLLKNGDIKHQKGSRFTASGGAGSQIGVGLVHTKQKKNKAVKTANCGRIVREDCKQVLWMKSELLRNQIPFEPEFRFEPKRRWKADIHLLGTDILIEYEGINSAKSRHTSITGFTNDCTKYNRAQLMGYKVLRYTALNYKDLITDLLHT